MRLATALCVLPGAALACALPPSVVLTLPTGHYMAGAAATVAVTGLVLAAAHRLPALRAIALWDRRVLLPVALTSTLSFLALAALIAIGFVGSTDPMHNLLTLTVWTVVWVALPLASLVFGNLWRAINPWTGPARLVRRAFGIRGGIGLSRLGHWPAVAGMFAFTWFTLVSLSPEDPRVLATVALGYSALILACAVAEGEDWLEQGEFLTVYLTMLARIAPLWLVIEDGRGRVCAGWPGTQVLSLSPLPASGVAFVTLVLAGLTFDGLHETFWWLALIGENPLEFTGRSAVQAVNTVGLVSVWAATAATILSALWLGGRLARRPLPTGPVMLSFLAIAAGYHGAHYLVTLMTTGQYTLAAINDPLFRGDAFLGLPPFYVGFGFLADPAAMTAVWNAQFLAILLAHVLAVILALHLAGRETRAVAHLPLTALMTGYTVLGLWLLSSPTGA
ncbi:MAG: hypothetical protein KF887_02305 [Paracoccaceae bacterium]|nr:MAG: hypothetical protein KF887_02305 [Paracoccaceae bacterium]